MTDLRSMCHGELWSSPLEQDPVDITLFLFSLGIGIAIRALSTEHEVFWELFRLTGRGFAPAQIRTCYVQVHVSRPLLLELRSWGNGLRF